MEQADLEVDRTRVGLEASMDWSMDCMMYRMVYRGARLKVKIHHRDYSAGNLGARGRWQRMGWEEVVLDKAH